MSFEELGLGPEVLKAIAERGYTTPTPIQAAAIPSILMTRDIVGLAQTGTGKTAAFTLPMIEILYGGRARARMPRSLILSPTRELAAQIAENFDTYGKYHKLTHALLVGGESMGDQMKLLDRGVDVLIATPGRMIDLFERGHILLNDIKILVIDEADRMLDMGFIPDIEKIVSLVPPIRQTLLFSATMPPEIKKLADKFLSNPKQIAVAATSSAATTVKQALVWTTRENKRRILDAIIRKEDVKNAFVFCNRKRDIADLASWLGRKGYSVAPMHGDMPQSARNATLQNFKDGKIVLLICSDVAARGLDVAAVSHVFNFDVPFAAEDYIHRIGRTGRAGMSGTAWTIATGDDDKFVDAIQRLLKQNIPVEKIEAGGGQGDRGDDREGGRHSRGDRGPRHRDHHDRPGSRSSPVRDRNATAPPPRHDQPRAEQPRTEQAREQPRFQEKRPRREEPAVADSPSGFGSDIPDFLRRK
jgi:superfamily II DNA/RNA helicase